MPAAVVASRGLVGQGEVVEALLSAVPAAANVWTGLYTSGGALVSGQWKYHDGTQVAIGGATFLPYARVPFKLSQTLAVGSYTFRVRQGTGGDVNATLIATSATFKVARNLRRLAYPLRAVSGKALKVDVYGVPPSGYDFKLGLYTQAGVEVKWYYLDGTQTLSEAKMNESLTVPFLIPAGLVGRHHFRLFGGTISGYHRGVSLQLVALDSQAVPIRDVVGALNASGLSDGSGHNITEANVKKTPSGDAGYGVSGSGIGDGAPIGAGTGGNNGGDGGGPA